jgi:hypothetical protein
MWQEIKKKKKRMLLVMMLWLRLAARNAFKLDGNVGEIT